MEDLVQYEIRLSGQLRLHWATISDDLRRLRASLRGLRVAAPLKHVDDQDCDGAQYLALRGLRVAAPLKLAMGRSVLDPDTQPLRGLRVAACEGRS